jgi:cell division protease FtsH
VTSVVAFNTGKSIMRVTTIKIAVNNLSHIRPESIIPCGISALGYTLQLPTEDPYLMTRSELLDRMAVLLGGRVAEEIKFGEVSTGAHNDLFRATDIARSMVKEYGMSQKLGPLTFKKRGPLFLEGVLPSSKEYSENTAMEMDEEIRQIVSESYEKVRNIIQEKRDKLEKVTNVLLKKEVIEGEELRKLIA